MIKFEALAIKTETDDIYIIFLLKKNIRSDIIKTILEYLPIAALETLKKQKMAITLVGQEYKSIESRQPYRTRIRIIYRRTQILGSQKIITTRTENQDTLITTFIDIWQRVAKN